MAYKLTYDQESDVLMLILKGKGKLSHAEEFDSLIVHYDKKGIPLFLEILNASKIVPLMVQAMAKGQAIASAA